MGWTNGKRDSGHRQSKQRMSHHHHSNPYRSSQGMMVNNQPVTYQNVDTNALHHSNGGRDAESVRKGGFWYNICSIITCNNCA